VKRQLASRSFDTGDDRLGAILEIFDSNSRGTLLRVVEEWMRRF
jgi:hypothetical protein